jgi:hypothetical protein
MMRRALAELRLAFHAMTDPEQFHGPYLGRNRVIAELLDAGRGEEAELQLYAYLADAEAQLLAVYEEPAVPAAPGPGTDRPDRARFEPERPAGGL